MRPLDWAVMLGTLASIVGFGMWRGRHSDNVKKYLLADKSMPWYAMALSIMATQASAVTFISTTGQSYVDGMRFVQFYFGLPIAMVVISAFMMPAFHRANVYTAYEFLEKRFDSKTRSLVSVVFLIQRGLGVGVSLSAPAVVLTVLLGWPDYVTTVLIGTTVITYTVLGGIQAITWADVQQMTVVFIGLFLALTTAVWLLPAGVSFLDAVTLAGAAGKLNAVVFTFDWNDRFNIWSGLFGATFLFLAYFGCDQSQVQRYLTGKSIAQSRLSLLFNALVKIPMQFFILFIGAMVFVFFTFEKPPLLFQKAELDRIRGTGEYAQVQQRFDAAFEARKSAAYGLVEARRHGDSSRRRQSVERYRTADKSVEAARSEGARLVEKTSSLAGFTDTNYIFLSFVTRYLPVGLVGLILAAIFGAAMSTISAEINSLATVSVIDLYQRHFRKSCSDRHYLRASRVLTAFWGVYAIVTAQFIKNLGSLVVAVNLLGSLFYGGMLGVFALAFLCRRVGGTAAFFGVLAGEAAIFYAAIFTRISFPWYNAIGCLVVVATGLALSLVWPRRYSTMEATSTGER